MGKTTFTLSFPNKKEIYVILEAHWMDLDLDGDIFLPN